uniref:Uncharacterized protein LOC113790646 n=1 Tax=Dermatophagoides pteronyssinus TaxID=6956 RepID=A0A6P6XTG3_DERPT|nr:uncharacterized protein LOC113790646 [Dermatophagoides pteronyssinus]
MDECEIAKTLLWQQFHSRYQCKVFMKCVYATLDKVFMKHNALAIFGDPGSGKTYFITMIKKLMWNAGHVESHINKTSNFPFENMFNKRIAVINEMNVSQSSIQVVKEILEGKDVCKRNLGNPRRRNQLRTYPLAAPLQQLSSTRLGSTHSFINEEIRKQLKLPWVEQGEIIVNQATSETAALGIVKIEVQIGVMVRNHLFYVLPINHDVIIGVDAMKKFQIYRDINGIVYQKIDSRNYMVETHKRNEVEVKLKNVEITEIEDEELRTLIRKYENVFAKEKGEIGQIKGEYCYINLENSIPINLKPYRTTVKDKERIDQQVKELLNRDAIRKSTSDYSSESWHLQIARNHIKKQ